MGNVYSYRSPRFSVSRGHTRQSSCAKNANALLVYSRGTIPVRIVPEATVPAMKFSKAVGALDRPAVGHELGGHRLPLPNAFSAVLVVANASVPLPPAV